MANTSAYSSSSSGVATANVIAEQPGVTLTEQDGVYVVSDENGQPLYSGNEIGAEFAYWRTAFGVPADDDSEVVE